ncbi:phage late control D family protein [Solirubrobacter soli]|uniref:phage late control D family protein n=1 Tax=Solirubrobacter soli TaxID=363832 RepID=UPI00040EA03A|nr:phage late control D family protein [Solirubrobacter soli]
MTVIALNTLTQPFYAPAFEVEVAGAKKTLATLKGPTTMLGSGVVKDVVEVTYHDSMDKVDSFVLVFNNWDGDRLQPMFLGSKEPSKLFPLIQPGTQLVLRMGYQGLKPDMRVMTTGVITTLEADFPEAGAPRLTVRGLNVLDRFRGKQFTYSWPADPKKPIKDSEIAEDLSGPPDHPPGRPGVGITVRADAAAKSRETPQPCVLMNNQYPIVFLMQRARRLGYDVFLDRDKTTGEQFLYFGPSTRVRDRTYKLEWGKSLVSFKPTISLARQVRKVTVLGWDRKAKQQIKGEATLEDIKDLNENMHPFIDVIGREEVVTDVPVFDAAQAKRVALDYLHRQVQDLAEAAGVVVGLPDLRAGRTVEIAGLGDLLNGRWFITETTHTINDSGYRTTFSARREEHRS